MKKDQVRSWLLMVGESHSSLERYAKNCSILDKQQSDSRSGRAAQSESGAQSEAVLLALSDTPLSAADQHATERLQTIEAGKAFV